MEDLRCATCNKSFLGHNNGKEILCDDCQNGIIGESDRVTPSIISFEPYLIKITDPALNVRKGPGIDHPIVKTLIGSKTIYTIVEEAEGTGAKKWGRLELESGIGWISLDYTLSI